MGISFSCPFSKYIDLEGDLDSLVVKSIDFGDDEVKTPVRSVSFKNRDSEPTVLKSLGSGKMTLEVSVSFKRKDAEEMMSTETLASDSEICMPTTKFSPKSQGMDDQCLRSEYQKEKIQTTLLGPNNPKHEAAIKLQKVYKSFRTRRKLADCAILVEQSWWKLLDFAELKHSSISFFDIEKHETAISRWSRARTRAAKVGKGLSKDDKAQKLALQHWLEAIDPRHRYGHNLHFYYDKWLQCHSIEPFFYWLDIGEGKEVNLEKCPRCKLQQQCIKYLGPMERLTYEVVVKDGRFYYKQSEELLHTEKDRHAKWIFVLSTSKTLYVGKKNKGTFQHSSFLAGGATSAAGRLIVEYGVLKAVWPHSGHYRPTQKNFEEFISFLQENNVNLKDVKMIPVDETCTQRSVSHIRTHSSEEELIDNISSLEAEGKANSMETKTTSALVAPKTRQFQIFGRELTSLEIPNRNQLLERLENEKEGADQETAPTFISEEDHTVTKNSSSDENQNDDEVETIPGESILKRINSHKETKSYQLGKQLSCKWTTGAGPRIGCVRDYPSELQFRALEQVSLSPRSRCLSKSHFASRNISGSSPRVLTPCSLCGETSATFDATALEKRIMSQRSDLDSRTESSPLIRGTSVIPVIHTRE
ncbi:hypothetical protein L6164_012450 [Bauhinia variegata]|uniref:Uncharacterized protein n=1 Tax=Bauhinia variegata TaxID=167791 RepID=A0ACB9PA63_BAUVA|nr:hypothetical protein L6164_012450 [Bauhinia variegata]